MMVAQLAGPPPRGQGLVPPLGGFYKAAPLGCGCFTRKFADVDEYKDDLHQLVSLIVAQRAPLPLAVVASVLGLGEHALHQRLMKLGVLFPLRVDVQGNQKVTFVTLMHKSLHDWLTEKNPLTHRPRAGIFAADPDLGNRLLAEEGWEVFSAGKLAQHAYFSQTLLAHLSEAQLTERLVATLLDPQLIDTLWSNECRDEWQRHIGSLRHTLSLTNLVQECISTHCLPKKGSVQNAAVAGKLCRLFQEMGAFDEAVLLAEAALLIWETNNVTDSPNMVSVLLALGRIYSVRERLNSATQSYEKALAIAEKAYAQESPQMADVLYDLCVFYTQTKRDYRKASECLEKCLVIRSRSIPPDLVGMANCINDRAVILAVEGRSADYRAIYEEALSLFEQAKPDGHPEMVATIGNIGHELWKEGKTAEAVEKYRRAVRMAERVLLPQHEYSRAERAGLASTLLSLGKYDEALDVMRTFVSDMERFPGPDHDDTAAARLQLCQTLWQAVHLSESARHNEYREELRAQTQRIYRAEPSTVIGLLVLAEDSRRAAEPSLRECLEEAAKRSYRNNAERHFKNPEDTVCAKYFADLLDILLSGKSLVELFDPLSTLWNTVKPQLEHSADCLPKTRKLVLTMISWIGRVRLARDQDVESIQMAFDLIDRIGSESPDTLDQLSGLAVSLHQYHHEEFSESMCERLLQKSEAILGSEHIQTLNYLENLAFLKMYRGKKDDAELMYQRALKTRLDLDGVEHANTINTISCLAECLLMKGEFDQVRRTIREFAANMSKDGFSSARKMLARTLRSTGQQLKNEFSNFDACKVCYELSLEFDPDSASTHNNMALLLWVCLNEPGAAADHFKKAMELDPKEGNTFSNYAHLLAQTLNDPKQALVNFEKAVSLSPNDAGIAANYAALLIQLGNLKKAWGYDKRSMRLCLPAPDRTMARALIGATAILMLRGCDVSVPIGQMKLLFTRGIDHAPWLLTATLDALGRQLPEELSALLKAISHAINDKKQLEALESNPTWSSIKPIEFDTPWSEPF